MLRALISLVYLIVVLSLFLLDNSVPVALVKALFFPSAIICLWSFRGAARFESIAQLTLCIIGLFHLGELASAFYQWGYQEDADAYRAYALVTLSGLHAMLACFFFLNYFFEKERYERMVIDFVKVERYHTYFAACLLVGVLGFLGLFFESLFSQTRSEMKALGFVEMFSFLLFFMAFFFSLSGVYVRIFGGFETLIHAGLVLVTAFTAFVVFKTRTSVLLPLACFFLGYYFLAGVASFRTETGIRLATETSRVFLAFLVGGGVATLIALRFLRGMLETGSYAFDFSYFMEKTFNGGDLGFGRVSVEAISYAMQNGILLEGQSYLRLIYVPVPRALWVDKPLSTQRLVGEWLMPSVDNMTMPPGIFADGFLNFGIWGGIVGIWWALFFTFLQRGLRSKVFRFCLYTVSLSFVFHISRGAVVNPIIGLSMSIAGVFLISRLYCFRRIS